jgi:hypothetical protein
MIKTRSDVPIRYLSLWSVHFSGRFDLPRLFHASGWRLVQQRPKNATWFDRLETSWKFTGFTTEAFTPSLKKEWR